MSYRPYSDFRDSGCEWLGNIPTHWDAKKNKFMFYPVKRLVGKRSKDFQLLSLTLKGIIRRDRDSGKGKFPAEFDTYKIVQENELVFCLFDLDETPRTIGLSKFHGMITGAYDVFRCLPDAYPEYVYYYYLHLDSHKGLRPFYTGLRKVVRSDTFSGILMPKPNLEEQTAIANFLDRETAKIDTLIDKQEQLIKLLEEKRQAVISHAVTKGLNPDVPMKDSGVEWLGEVPEHWAVTSSRHLMRILRGRFSHRPRNEPRFYGGKHAFVQTGDVARATVYIRKYKQTLNDEGYGISKEFPAGTLLMVITGAKTGHVAILDFKACAPDSVVGFVPNRGQLDVEFLYFFFISIHKLLMSHSTMSTQENLNIDRIGETVSTFPPLNEQKEIVKLLRKFDKENQELLSKIGTQLTLLKERRTALISAAVTGDIDVREAV